MKKTLKTEHGALHFVLCVQTVYFYDVSVAPLVQHGVSNNKIAGCQA